jgi:hypothetical protein
MFVPLIWFRKCFAQRDGGLNGMGEKVNDRGSRAA